MVQIVPPDADWSKAFRNIGAGVSQGYMNRADENAIQSAIEGLGENPEPRALLNAVMGVNTYSPESKQRAMQNLMGVEQFEESRKVHQQQQEQKQAELRLEAHKANIEQMRKDKDLEERAQRAQSLVSMIPGLSEEQIEQLKENIGSDDKTAKDLYVSQLAKEGKMSDVDKIIAKRNVTSYLDAKEKLPVLEDYANNIELAQELSDGIGVAGAITNKFFNTEAGKKLHDIGIVLTKAPVEIFNPTGPIATRKFEVLLKEFGISPGDFPWVRNAKLAVLRRLNEQAIGRQQKKIEMYEQYGGNPPKDVLEKFSEESQQMFDSIVEGEKKDLSAISKSNPKDAPNKIITSPDGQKYYSDGKSWQKL